PDLLWLANLSNRCGLSMTRSEMNSTLTVWYNTKCPVCNAGIEWQRRRLVRAVRAGVIEFRDINLEPDVLSRFGDPALDRIFPNESCNFRMSAWLRVVERAAAFSFVH